MVAITVKEFFTGKNIFVTGFSGFLGKALVEKLLRFCPNIGNIYVLLRSKKGVSSNDRLEQVLSNSIFNTLKEQSPNFINKIIVIPGDISELNLGISEENRKILQENVNIIYHVAATVKFTEPLQKAIFFNTRGTREICNLALTVKKLDAFAHISTTFCNLDHKVLEERIYPPIANWKEVIELAENVDDLQMAILAEKYLGIQPNTYSFTKHLAEHVVNDMCNGKIPVLIIRPPIVLPAAEEPIKGWTDNFNGPMGLVMGASRGLIRTMLYDTSQPVLDQVPVDQVTKVTLAATYVKVVKEPKEKLKELDIYNATPKTFVFTSSLDLKAMLMNVQYDTTLKYMLWSPNMHFTKSLYLFYIFTILWHVLPAILLDGIFKVIGRKPMFVKLQRFMYSSSIEYSYFNTRHWSFPCKKVEFLPNYIPTEEHKDLIPLYDISQAQYVINVNNFVEKYMFHIVATKSDKIQNQIMRVIHRITKFCFYTYVLYTVYKFSINYITTNIIQDNVKVKYI